MNNPTRRSLAAAAFLALLVSVLAYIVYARGLGLKLGGAPAELRGSFKTEEAWVVDDIVRDIAEMSAYPTRTVVTVAVLASPDAAGVYRISGVASAPVELDLRQELWSPSQFAVLARVTLASGRPAARPSGDAFAEIHPTLLDLAPASLVAANAAISKALASDMRDARAHEAAALTLGAFALRESAGRFSDTRWAMNRMTAHLGMAAALRGDAEPDVDARLAAIILQILTDQQTRALDALDRLPADRPSPAVAAWARALRLRITQDTRTFADPTHASRLEKREYFRARRSTVPSTVAGFELDRLAVTMDADWYRIIEMSGIGVEDGGDIVSRVLGAERGEAADVFARMQGRPIDQDSTAALNARAVRTIGDAGPQILPWGAWAEFAQRHIAMFVGKSDNHYRHIIGDEHGADTEKQRLKADLGRLTMFPIATIFWTKGVRGGDADLGLINEAIDAASAAPERVPPAAWSFLAGGARYEPVRRGFPPPNVWFIAPEPRAAYEAALRVKETEPAITREAMAAMLRDAPYDSALASEYLRIQFGEKPPPGEVRKAFGPRLEYDVRLLRVARGYVAGDAVERTRMAKSACDLIATECIALGWELANADRASEAAASYERAFADPSLDAIALSNASGWLVSYYYRHGRTAAALALAERSASTGSWQGLITAGYLYERLGRVEDAEAAFRQSTGYDDLSQLIGFYYRAVVVRKQMQFEPAWKIALAQVFPNGLVPVTKDEGRPARGVVVVNDSERSRTAGLQASDVIVGLEGWRVESYQQYTAINAFFEQEQMQIVAWRGHLFPVTVSGPNRLIGTELRTFPIAGWRDPR